VPELPEVETVRRGLAAHVVGRRVTAVEVGRERTVRRTSAREVIDGLTGATFLAAGRRGKYLLLPLDTGDTVMVHLRMTGQLLLAPLGTVRPRHTHVVLTLAADRQLGREAAELWFVDPRTFGEVVVYDPDHVAVELPELARLGVDPLADGLDVDGLRRLLAGRRTRMKALLLDQHVIAGIGNIYADEILHAARIHPDRPAGSLRRVEVALLHVALHRILEASVRAGGSTLGDNQYVDLMGAGGSYQDEHLVYGRAGLRCPTCGRGVIRRTVTAGRSTHHCPWCQRPPKPASDRSSRRFLAPKSDENRPVGAGPGIPARRQARR
jgi:formamidopyrimidine-DNA glycosylase